MNRIIAALIAGAFAFASAAAMADDQPVDQAKLKAERDKAQADYAKMTPEEKAAYKKRKDAERQRHLEARQPKPSPTTPAQTEAVKAAKSHPDPLPDAKAHQEAIKQMEKQPSGGSN